MPKTISLQLVVAEGGLTDEVLSAIPSGAYVRVFAAEVTGQNSAKLTFGFYGSVISDGERVELCDLSITPDLAERVRAKNEPTEDDISAQAELSALCEHVGIRRDAQ